MGQKRGKADNLDKTTVHRGDCRKAAQLILGGFWWRGSREGTEYWAEVCRRLYEIAALGKIKPTKKGKKK